MACPDSVARKVLIALCHDPAARKKALKHLKHLTEAGNAASTETTSKKRKADDLEICGRCGQPFTEASNSAKACRYHDGTWMASLPSPLGFEATLRTHSNKSLTGAGELEPDYDGDFWA